MDELIKVMLNAFIGAITGTLAAFITAGLRFKELDKQARLRLKEFDKQFELKVKELKEQFELQQSAEREREKEKIRLQYLNPLRISAEDLYERICDISDRLKDKDKAQSLTTNFRYINDENIINREDFEKWCNIDGYYYVSTLYITNLYFASASKIRLELPFIQLTPESDQKLLELLSKVRKSFGGRYGIWETIQDSLGTYIRRIDNTIMNYKEFCKEIVDKNQHIWFVCLISFYRDILNKENYEVKDVREALNELIKFLKEVSKAL